MSSWESYKLSELCQIYDGPHATPPKTMVGNVFLGISSINYDGRIDNSQFEYVDDEYFAKWTRRILPIAKDIVFSYETKLGTAAIIPEGFKCCLGRRMGLLRCNNKVVPEFLLYYYLSPEFQGVIQERTYSGSTVDRIPLKEMGEFPVRLPSLLEQKAIASVLSSLDDKIDLLHRQNKTLEAMAETLFRQWFIEEAKEDWDEVQVKEVTTLNRRSVGKNYIHGDILYLDTGSLTKGVVGELQSYSLNEAPSRAKRLVQHNDILISTVRPNQCHYGIVSEPKDNLVVSTGFCTITCETISPYFVYLLLTNTEMTEYLHSIAEGSTSTYPSLKPEDIGAVVFQMPPKELLQQFHNLAESYWQKIHSNHKQIQTLENLRDTLLPKLMSGEVRVEYQTKEVA